MIYVHLSIFFQSIPSLGHLTIEIYDLRVNRYQWQKIIVNYLSKIIIFQLKIDFLKVRNIHKRRL